MFTSLKATILILRLKLINLSDESTDEYFKAMDDRIQSIMRRETWEILLRKSIYDHNVLPVTWSSRAIGNLIGKSVNSRHDII